MTDDINSVFSDFGARNAKIEELLKKYQTINENGEIVPAQTSEEKQDDETSMSETPVQEAPKPKKKKVVKKKTKKLKNKNNISEEINSVENKIEEPTVEEPVVEESVIEEPVIEEPAIEEPVVEDSAIGQFDFDMSEQEIELFDLEMNAPDEIIEVEPEAEEFIEFQPEPEEFDFEIDEVEELNLEIDEVEELDFDIFEPQQVDLVEEEPVQFNFSMPELEAYESAVPESEQFDFSKDFDLLVPEQPEEIQPEPEQFDFATDELEQFDYAADETEQPYFEPEQFEETIPETEQFEETMPEIEQFEEAMLETEQFEETMPEPEQFEEAQPENGFSFDDRYAVMQEEAEEEAYDEPDYSYDLDMFGTSQSKSTIDIDSFDDSWLDTALDRTLFYNAIKPTSYDMPDPEQIPIGGKADAFESNVHSLTQENSFVEQFPDDADKNAMAGGYIAPSDFSDFNFDPDSGLDFDYEETNSNAQDFYAEESTGGLKYGEEFEKKNSERTKQPASRIFQKFIKPPKEKDQNKMD